MLKLISLVCLVCLTPSLAHAQNDEKKSAPPAESAKAAAVAPSKGASTSEGSAESGIFIKVGEAKVKKSLVALPAFQFQGQSAATPQFKELGAELYNTVLNDLEISAYFEFISQRAFLEDPAKVGLKPAPGDPNGFKYENWKQIGAEFLIRGAFKLNKEKSEVEFQAFVYHVPQAKQVLSKEYVGQTKDIRRIGHTFANDIVKNLTGKPGNFLSRIVVASDRAGNSFKELYIMDWDARNPRKISDHKSIVLSPAWSPDAKTVVYTAYAYHAKAKTRNADLFSYELSTGKRFLLSSRPGINSGAAFDNDGKSIYLTISQGGNPDIFKMGDDGTNLSRITNGPIGAMNVEPAISPDGKTLAFSSDRSGQPMIYTMKVDGSGIKRMTFAGKYNATPGWSPDGKKLVFAGWDKSHFDVFIMNADGTGLERLTTANKKNGKPSNNDDPTFSVDGRQILFISDRSGTKQIYIINADGTNERRLTSDSFNYFRPKWSRETE
ncbi:MAG: DPP IV N-terminal domain-containing protein [Bdellovibrionales bacterium]|nr:DPP IV N-terminal domain-containing protein [Bdellovibrionales bacterium]